MNKAKPIQVIDLFAGPGGLGEGFSSLEDRFKILVSAEMDQHAHSTLRLRAFFRLLKKEYPKGLKDYYNFCNGLNEFPFTPDTLNIWNKAECEARRITLGSPEGNKEIDEVIEQGLDKDRPWVLIGGPPCQAYSLVGRARNKGNLHYEAEKDHRHFLYKEYLRIIAQYRPTAFVMENVKGILSSKVAGRTVFHDILNDLSAPQIAVGSQESEAVEDRYVICSLTSGNGFRHGDRPEDFDAREFIIRAEEYGVPQARHRVILLGIKESVYRQFSSLQKNNQVSLSAVISQLPPLRSKLSRRADNQDEWYEVMKNHIESLLMAIKTGPEKFSQLSNILISLKDEMYENLNPGTLRLPSYYLNSVGNSKLKKWYEDEGLKVWLNHESRGHMSSDLKRYLFASIFASYFKQTPKGSLDFDLPGLKPNHKNWESGKFSDRFRVQVLDRPSTTITSHISKDGHYFIHPDPRQCRSLTVREAARLQTFPDNYFFQGNRTQQFHQVGNAVPPFLAHQIANIVSEIIS